MFACIWPPASLSCSSAATIKPTDGQLSWCPILLDMHKEVLAWYLTRTQSRSQLLA